MACTSVVEGCVHVFAYCPGGHMLFLPFLPPIPAVLLWNVLPSQRAWHFIYFKLKVGLTATQFWVTCIHGLEFWHRIVMCILVTCIVRTKYLTRSNIRKEGFVLTDGVRGCSPSCMEAMAVGMWGSALHWVCHQREERYMLEFSCFLPFSLWFHPCSQPTRWCHPYSA